MKTGYIIIGGGLIKHTYNIDEAKEYIEKYSHSDYDLLVIEDNKPIRKWCYGVSNIRFIKGETEPQWFSREIS